MQPIKSAQLSGLTEIFHITQIQKLRILTQKNIPPPKKKRPFFGGVEITRPLNLGITWADNSKLKMSKHRFHMCKRFT